MVDYTGYAGIGIGVLFLFLFIWIMSKMSRHRAEYGTGLERDVELKTGLGSIGKKLKSLVKVTKSEKKKGQIEEKKEEAEEAVSKSRGSDKAEVEAEKGAVSGAKAAEEGEESIEALTTIEGRAVGLVAGLQLIAQAIEQYVSKESQEEAKENQEVNYITTMINQIGQVLNYKQIDSQVISYLEQFTHNLLQYLNAEIGTESAKEIDMKELMSQLREAIKEMKQVLSEAKTEARIFKKFERKEQKDYRAEIKELSKSIKLKEKELKAARKEGKGADKNLIANLEREIALMRKQHSAASRLDSQLKSTFKMMDKEIKETRKIIKKLLKKDKYTGKFDKTLEKTESKSEKKFKQMKESFNKLEQAIKSFDSSKNVHGIALSLSKNLNEFLKENKDLELMTRDFDKALRDIVAIGFEMARLTEAYERMIQGLTDSEKAVDQGMEVLTKIMQSVTSDSEMQVDEGEVVKTLDELNELLDYEERLEKYISQLIRSIEAKYQDIASLIDRLASEDSRVIESIERSSQNIGSLMAHATNRKIEIDEQYMSQAERFESQLNQRNAAASRAYNKARSAEFRS